MLTINDQNQPLQELSSKKTSQIKGGSDIWSTVKTWLGIKDKDSFYGGGSFGGGGASGSW